MFRLPTCPYREHPSHAACRVARLKPEVLEHQQAWLQFSLFSSWEKSCFKMLLWFLHTTTPVSHNYIHKPPPSVASLPLPHPTSLGHHRAPSSASH